MRFVKAVNLGLMAALAGVSCNPNDFSAALDKAPVVSFDNGSSSGSLFVLPLSSPSVGGTKAARMLVSRKDSPYLAVANYDKDGEVTLQKVGDSEMEKLGIGSVVPPVNSAATLGSGSIIVGTPRYGATGTTTAPGRVSLLTLTDLADGTASLSIQGGPPGIDHYGISVAAGRVTDLAGAGEFVVVSDSAVDLLSPDGKTVVAGGHAACSSLALYDETAGLYGNRPVVVADLVADGGEEIVVSGLGRVVFLQYNRTSASLACLDNLVLKQGAEGSQAPFGTSLAVADFDGDGNLDLAVGSPPDRVYVYFGPLPLEPKKPEVVTIVGAPGSTGFGKRLSTYPMPVGKGGDRLMVDDPGAMANGRSAAGKITLLTVPRRGSGVVDAASLTVSTLFDSADDSPIGVFGDSLGTLPFDPHGCGPAGAPPVVPWASSGTSVLTYFNFPGNAADPRCSK